MSGPGSEAEAPPASLLERYRETRRLTVGTTSLFLVLSLAFVLALTWQVVARSRRAAELAASRFEQRLGEIRAGLGAGSPLPGARSRYRVDLGSRIQAGAAPGFLSGLSVRGNMTHQRALAQSPGEVHLALVPDLADMKHRVLVCLRLPEGLAVASFAAREVFVPHVEGERVYVTDAAGLCRYASDPVELGLRLDSVRFVREGTRVWVKDMRPLAGARELQLVVKQDFTSEALVVLTALALTLGLCWVLWRTRRLDRELSVLASEAEEVKRAIEGFRSPLSQRDPSSAALREALREPLAAARRLAPRFEENRLNVALLSDLAEQALELLELLESRGEELAESEARLERALIEAPLPLLLYAEDGEVLLVNRAWSEQSGFRAEELATLEDWERLSATDAGERLEGKVALRTASGVERTWEFASADLGELPDGRGLRVTLANDVSERERLQSQTLVSEKLRSIGQLAGGIAHDFNNQLTVILAIAELLEDRADEELAEEVRILKTTTRRSAELTQQLLAFAARGKNLSDEVDLHALVREVLALLERSVDKRITLAAELEAARATIAGDPNQLQSALLNLGLNACQAMPEGGRLLFRTRLREGRLELEVRDEGQGIAPEFQARVFEPFFTTKGSQGTGLGLAAVYGTVQSHGGEIELESEVGRGATFRLRFPLDERRRPASARREEAREPSPSSRVLLVEDEAAVATVMRAMLRRLGHEVVHASRGGAALERFRAEPLAFDLAVVDLGLPDMDGGEVTLALLEERPELPVVVASGYARNEHAQGLLERGARAFLPKPFDLAQLRASLARAWGRPVGEGVGEAPE